MDLTETIAVPLITALVYLVAMGYKYAVDGNQKLIRLTPIFAGLFGMILGIVAFFAASDLMPATNVLSAMLVGAVSGLAATGGDQIYRQLSKGSMLDLQDDGKLSNDGLNEKDESDTNEKK